MHFVILIVFVAAVYGRDLSDAGYYPARPYDRYNTQYINSPPPEVTERYEENNPNKDNYENHRQVGFNINRQVNDENHGDLSNNDRNGRRNNFPNTEHRHTHGVVKDMDVNLGFERQSPKRHRDGNLNLPKQSFNVNDEYSKRDFTNNDSNRSYHQHSPGSDGDMVFMDDDDHDKRKTTVKPYNDNNKNNNGPEMGIISFLNNVNTNITDTNINSKKQTETQSNGSNNKSQFELKSGTVDNTDQRPSKTTIENEVTPNPFRRDSIANENKTVEEDKWVWSDGGDADVEATTMTTTLVTLDDRAAFDGGKCATGMARVQGICVKPD